ncbi:hypothetical protein [Odoribacter lunatus]|uniref:DUF7935 family protein n=1 Tax=Odoribacter lunatus TaxID=2941335 RepID=UPI00203B7624|nr:hypothetical protein [Odoribacter lunatus]
MTITDFLLIALIVFVLLLYPLFRKILSLLEIVVKQYVHSGTSKSGQPAVSATQTLLNLKLLAYERIVLFIERMKPDSLIPRTMTTGYTNQEYHQLLLSEIRKEFEYNLSQQLYLSESAWTIVSNFKNNITTLINTSANDCVPTEPASNLAKKILEKYIASDIKVDQILQAVKSDIA